MTHRVRPGPRVLVLVVLIAGLQSKGGEGPPAVPPPPPPALRPPAVRPGDAVMLVAPASPARPAEIEEVTQNLRRQGFRVKVAAGATAKAGYLAGDDEGRAAALNQAFADPEVRLVICVRGGYGSPRILDRIDYDLVRRNPKVVVGFSDITAVLIALRQRTGLVTFHGPMASKDFSGKAGLSPFAEQHLFGLIGPAEFRAGALPCADWGRGGPRGEPRRALSGGAAEGPLIGGNLSIVSSLMGTPYEIDTRGSILFLEDVNEEPFRIDRMLCQLRLSGKLAAVRGVLLGGFTNCVARTPQESFTLEEVLAQYFPALGVPVLTGFPAGHLPEQAALPFGVRVRLDADRGTLSILEPSVEAQPGAGASPLPAGGPAPTRSQQEGKAREAR